jgi:hypothetical protein
LVAQPVLAMPDGSGPIDWRCAACDPRVACGMIFVMFRVLINWRWSPERRP